MFRSNKERRANGRRVETKNGMKKDDRKTRKNLYNTMNGAQKRTPRTKSCTTGFNNCKLSRVITVEQRRAGIVFYNRDEKCLLRGTNWVFK